MDNDQIVYLRELLAKSNEKVTEISSRVTRLTQLQCEAITLKSEIANLKDQKQAIDEAIRIEKIAVQNQPRESYSVRR